MSTVKYYPNYPNTFPAYDIGVGGMSHISSWVGKQGKDISTFPAGSIILIEPFI
jgi:hypothetical protein